MAWIWFDCEGVLMSEEIINELGLKKIDLARYQDNEFAEWHKIGLDKGWVSEVFCDMHEGGPITDEEGEAIDRDEQPCLPHVRVWY
jgi:hypothetical protein